MQLLAVQGLLLLAICVRAKNSYSDKTEKIAIDTGFFLSSSDLGPASKIILHGTLVTFNAASGKNFFSLTWNSMGEIPCDHYDIERSNDGVTYKKVGEVKGFSNSSSEETYSFRDNFRPLIARKNDFYYRLRLVDANGQASYSKVLIARMYNTKTLASLSVTPDPTINDILVNVQLKENAFVVMKITDQQGNQLIRKAERAENGLMTYRMEGSNQLHAGRYFLEVIVNSNERLTMQLEKS